MKICLRNCLTLLCKKLFFSNSYLQFQFWKNLYLYLFECIKPCQNCISIWIDLADKLQMLIFRPLLCCALSCTDIIFNGGLAWPLANDYIFYVKIVRFFSVDFFPIFSLDCLLPTTDWPTKETGIKTFRNPPLLSWLRKDAK